jgi:hypothetical protein
MSNLGKHIAGIRAIREARKIRAVIELARPGMDQRAPALWCIAAAVRLWRLRRLRRVEEYERRRGWAMVTLSRPAPRSTALVQLWRVALPGLSLPARAVERVADVVVGDLVTHGAFSRAAAAVGRCLRYGLSRYEHPLERRKGVGAKMLEALRHKVGRSEEARMLVVMQARMLKWGKLEERGHGTLSGKPKEPL